MNERKRPLGGGWKLVSGNGGVKLSFLRYSNTTHFSDWSYSVIGRMPAGAPEVAGRSFSRLLCFTESAHCKAPL